MKRFALVLAAVAAAGPAMAADVVYDEPPAPAPIEAAYNWTGLYIGAQAGIAFGGSDGASGVANFPNTFETFRKDGDVGFTGGGHIGYDYQFGTFILGAVADINYIDRDRKMGVRLLDNTPIDGGSFYANDVDIDYFGTVRGKVGAAMDRFAVYATGGLAYGGTDNDVRGDSVFASPAGTVYRATVDTDDDKVGYSVGAGVDVLATQNVSFGLEYLYTDLGQAKSRTTFTSVGTPVVGNPTSFTADTKTDVDFHTIMAKAAYRFN